MGLWVGIHIALSTFRLTWESAIPVYLLASRMLIWRLIIILGRATQLFLAAPFAILFMPCIPICFVGLGGLGIVSSVDQGNSENPSKPVLSPSLRLAGERVALLGVQRLRAGLR